jgi:hypothetical protein
MKGRGPTKPYVTLAILLKRVCSFNMFIQASGSTSRIPYSPTKKYPVLAIGIVPQLSLHRVHLLHL